MYPWISRTLDFWLQFCEKKCGLFMDVYGMFACVMIGQTPAFVIEQSILLGFCQSWAYLFIISFVIYFILLLYIYIFFFQLKDEVSSPGGTTIAGIQTLERSALRSALIDAVETATKRATEIAEQGK